MSPLDAALWITAAYLVGAVPFGLLLGFTRGVDIRTIGSGNIGATNARRALGPALGNTAFVLDVLKGAAPVLAFGLAHDLIPPSPTPAAPTAVYAAVALAAILGHVFPVYLRFKGGKGVATSLGALAALYPFATLPTLAALAVWIAALKLTRYVSVASIAAALSLPLAVAALAAPTDQTLSPHTFWDAAPVLAATALLAALVVYRHRGNIARLAAGEEPRVGSKKNDRPDPKPADDRTS